ncbi:PAS domain S-box protein [Methylopila sp. M107]|uniref:PAS domain S-box protein n=1 Tax=Methylopila sp. M107 TaxID=1101190 RepID=UPI00037BB78B|nr:PAS domain S-box protein [Methylopila sp. M107]
MADEADDAFQRQRAILESVTDVAIVATDLAGLVTDWNFGAERIFGWSAQEMTGRSVEDFFTPEDRANRRLRRQMSRAAARGRAIDECWRVRKNGERFWASGEMTPLRSSEGAHIGFVKILRDRTEQHLHEAALQRAERRLRRAQEAGGVGLFSVGVDDNVLHATPEFCRLYGMPERETFDAGEFERLVLPEDQDMVSSMEGRRRGLSPTDVVYRIRRANDGEIRWISRKGEFESDGGRSVRFAGASRDITSDVLRDREIAAEREQLAAMFEQAPTFMAMLRGPGHRIERVNPGYTRLVGGRDVVGRTVAEALPDAVAQGYLGLLDEVYRSGRAFTATGYKYAVQAVEGGAIDERFVDFVYQPIRDAQGAVSGVFVEGVDVTERMSAATALAASEERYRTLFETIDVGFCILEMKFDGAGRAVDYRIAEANPAFVRQTGADVVGKWVSEFAPGLERHWFDTYGAVALTGEPAHFENRADVFGRWFDVRAVRIGDPAARTVAVFFADITQRRETELHQAALLELSDRLRELRDPAEIAFAACEILGTTLGVSRVGYGVIDKRRETIEIDRDWNAPGVSTLAGTLSFRDYGTYIEDLKRGDVVAIADATRDPRTAPTAAALKAISAQAFVNMPLVEQGQSVALLYANHAAARGWSDGELTLMRQFAERVRAASERLRSENALRESEEQFRVFAQAMPSQIWAALSNGELYWFNSQVYAYTGTSPGDLHGASGWEHVVHPDDMAAAGEAWARSLVSGEVYETEFRIRRRDGAYRWFLVRAEPVRGADNEIARWIGANTDIDDAKRAAEKLERLVAERTADRNELWRMSADIMLRCTFDGRIVAVNPAWTEMLGWDESELVGASIFDFIHPDDVGKTAEGASASSKGRAFRRFDNRYRTKDGGYRWISWSSAPSKGLINAVGRDFSAEKEAADALAKSEDALRQAQKMEAVGQLTGGIAHDFNNLLTGITGSLDLMLTRIRQGRVGEIERYVDVAQGAAKRAAALTHRLLAFSRRQTLDPQPTDVNRLIAGMEDLLRRTVGPQIRLDVVAAPGLFGALVDPHQLENAILNLVINARDAMPDGGRIAIETSNVWLDERKARESELPPGRYLSISVADTGTGMSPTVIERAFEPFYTTKPLGQGTGLGLSMIYGFTRQSGGQARIQSEVGRGATISIYLPRHDGEDAAPSTPARPIRSHRAEAGQTVMIVDDEPTVRLLVIEVLEDSGYAAIDAVDGPSAMKILGSDVRIDLLITDVGLPGGMNGRQVADAARAARPGLKVMFITGYAESAVFGNGPIGPGMSVVTKPFDVAALEARIREMIAA